MDGVQGQPDNLHIIPRRMGWHYVLCEISILTKKTIMKKETALKILRELHAQALFSERTALETLIPGLVSEDERIRKFLYDTFTEQYLCKDKFGKWHGEPVVNILAWLEKQREQKQHLELKAGHWYICHRAYCCRADHLTVKEGERFKCEEDGIVKGFIIKEPEKYFIEISTPVDIEENRTIKKINHAKDNVQ